MGFLVTNCAFLALVLGYSWWAGDTLDRFGVSAVIAALVLTFLANLTPLFTASSLIVLGIDLVLLVAMTALALMSPRHWPVWFAGFQLAAVLFGAAALLVPVENVGIYRTLSGFFAIPAMLAMAFGLFLDRVAAARHDRGPAARGGSEAG